MDISRRQGIPAVVQQARKAMGGIDTLINNAGISDVASFPETPLDNFDEVIAINYLGTIDITRACLPIRLEADDAMLITLGSLAGLIPVFGYTETPMLAYENKMKPPETHALAGTVRPMAAAIVARTILEGAQRGDFEVFVDSESKMIHWLVRYMPRVSRWYMDRLVRGARVGTD